MYPFVFICCFLSSRSFFKLFCSIDARIDSGSLFKLSPIRPAGFHGAAVVVVVVVVFSLFTSLFISFELRILPLITIGSDIVNLSKIVY